MECVAKTGSRHGIGEAGMVGLGFIVLVSFLFLQGSSTLPVFASRRFWGLTRLNQSISVSITVPSCVFISEYYISLCHVT